MIKLYQFGPCWGLASGSPFCLKVETYLRMAEISYEVHVLNDPRKSPKGKLPFIKDDTKVVADSSLILDYLKNKYGDTLDVNLTKDQKTNALAMQRLVEEHLYWAVLYSRWFEEANWQIVKEIFFKGVPAIMRNFVAEKIRKKMKNDLYAHGIGRHSRDEIYQMGMADIAVLAEGLADKPYFFGKAPTSFDATAYAFIASIFKPPLVSPLKDYVNSLDNLKQYVNRIEKAYYNL